jgi:hypothetical protein
MRVRTPGSTAGALDIGGDKAGRLVLLVDGPVERGGTGCGRLWEQGGPRSVEWTTVSPTAEVEDFDRGRTVYCARAT